jgi:glycosyltransferase involved in cell wall biosynthesis
VKRRLGVVGTVIYPDSMDARTGDLRTWFEVGAYFDDITIIAQRRGWFPRSHSVNNVRYVLLPRLPRTIDLLAFPPAATVIAFVMYARGVRTWSFSDPLRSGLVCLAMRPLGEVRLVVHLQGQLLRMPSNRFKRWTPVVEALSRFVARRADTVRVVSHQIAQEAVAAGVDPNRIMVVPSRCDTELFDPIRWHDAGDAMRASLPGDAASPVVGFLGSLNGSKGIDVLIGATSSLARRRAVRLAVAGDGPLRPQVERAANGCAFPIASLGRVGASEVPAFLAAVDVLAVPSYDEGLPRVVLEAMAMQVPVVASSVGGIPEAIEDGRSGLLVAPGDEEALAAALDRVLEDPALGARLGEAARSRVLDEFNAEAIWPLLAAVHG